MRSKSFRSKTIVLLNYSNENNTYKIKSELAKLIGKANNKKAPGLDGIPMETIKVVGKIFTNLLLSIYNKYLKPRIS